MPNLHVRQLCRQWVKCSAKLSVQIGITEQAANMSLSAVLVAGLLTCVSLLQTSCKHCEPSWAEPSGLHLLPS